MDIACTFASLTCVPQLDNKTHKGAVNWFKALAKSFPTLAMQGLIHPSTQLINGDLLKDNTRQMIVNSDVIFSNNLLFGDVKAMGTSLNSYMAKVLASHMPAGSVVITTCPIGVRPGVAAERTSDRSLNLVAETTFPCSSFSWCDTIVKGYAHVVHDPHV
jgi:hypothetical protein